MKRTERLHLKILKKKQSAESNQTYSYIRGSLNKFPDFFRMAILMDSTHMMSWRQHPTKHQMYGHLPPITKTIKVRRTRHTGHCWRSRDELISDVLVCNPPHGRAKAGQPARTDIQQLQECCPEDQPEAMNDRVEWRERVRDIRAGSTT